VHHAVRVVGFDAVAEGVFTRDIGSTHGIDLIKAGLEERLSESGQTRVEAQ
jgi:hypothetical protein